MGPRRSLRDLPAAREERQRRLGDAVKRWHDEERRLFRLMKTFKERARYSPDWAKKADAAETRWRRFARRRAAARRRSSTARSSVRMRGGDSARRVLDLRSLELDGLVVPFSDEIHFGERVGVIGPNGIGQERADAGARRRARARRGELVIGPRVSTGFFTQLQSRGDLAGRGVLDVVLQRVGGRGLQARDGRARPLRAAPTPRGARYDVLSGGEKARLEVLVLELEGHNLLLLDEPTDNLDIDSSEALEQALERLRGHGRRRLARPRVPAHDGPLPDGPARRCSCSRCPRMSRRSRRCSTPNAPARCGSRRCCSGSARRAGSDGYLRAHRHGALARQTEVLDRARRIARHRHEQLLAPASHSRSVVLR